MIIREFMQYVVDQKASDLHMKAGGPPYVRVNGRLSKTHFSVLTSGDCERAAMELMSDEQARQFKQRGEADFAYSEAGLGRFRVNVFRQRGSVALACRRVLPGSPSFETLGLPPAVKTLAEEQRGLVLVTGPTSSGKTTTTAAMINHINATRSCHVLTIEDPIEILHPDRTAIVNQREVGQDTNDFAVALRAAMRQDPDVIFVGEIRDTETVKAALQAAETGHLVVSTLHTTDVSETINRIIDFFPPHQQKQTRVSIAGSLRGVVSQRLVPRMDGRGLVPAVEIMVMNGRVRDLILNDEQTYMLHDLIKESGFYGMQTFDQALLELYRSGMVELDEAMRCSTNPHDFQIALRQEGLQPIS
ncbi:MAG: type IV pilus twitching motility protein PilT [Actinomycetota bacterium]|nr:type IV pilus twitching motility protein PilT [Actinomycetota bacterium]